VKGTAAGIVTKGIMKKAFTELPVRTKLLIPAMVLLAALGGFVALYFSGSFERRAYLTLAQTSNRITGLVARRSAAPLRSKDRVGLRAVLDSIGRAENLHYLVIAVDPAEVAAEFNMDAAQSSLFRTEQQFFENVFKTAAPIVDRGRALGTVYIGIRCDAIQAEVIRYRWNAVLIGVILFIVGSGFLFGVFSLLLRPLTTMVGTAERAAAGTLTERATSPFSDELGTIAHSINAMLMNTDAAYKRAESLAALLSKREQQLKVETDQRHLIEKQVQLSDEIINKVNALIIVSNRDGGIEYASPSFDHVLGYKPEDLLNDGWWKVLSEDLAERRKEKTKTARCARGEQPVGDAPYERQIVDARGNLRWVLWQDTLGLNDTLIGVGQDITERKLADEQLREQAALLDITGDAIVVRNLDHRILFWNNGAERLYGMTSADAIGQSAHDLFEQESCSGIGNAYESVIENGTWSGELRQVTKQGKTLTVESRWTLMSDESGKPKSILVVNTDVTEQRQMEVQFRRAQRLENIGTLAGGIAHDLNNVLTPILMSIQALQKRHGDERTQQLLSTIDLSARRGADIVKQVLTFARGTEGERTLLQPKHILREIEKITKETFPRSIEIKPNIATDLWTITGDATQLHQIILNLLVNARDAMPEGGTLSLRAANVVLDEAGARQHLNAKPGNYVIFAVKDTGTGIPPEVLDKIFDPFFTTKEVGKGTGLGLSTVMAIVKSYTGFILVDSKAGEGTEFSVYIPATGSVASARSDEDRLNLPSGHGEAILVVDDELSIRQITKETLEAYGYRIETAKDGIDALTLIEKDPNKFSLVLTDMMMPNMDGGSLIRTLRHHAPNIKVVAVSGITDHDVLEKIKKSKIEAFLPKPIETSNLLKVLDSVLHADEEQTPV